MNQAVVLQKFSFLTIKQMLLNLLMTEVGATTNRKILGMRNMENIASVIIWLELVKVEHFQKGGTDRTTSAVQYFRIHR